MTPEQMQSLTEKVTNLGYPEPDIEPGEEGVLMLHVCDCFICGALYALTLPDTELQALIDETVTGGQ